MQNIKHKKTRKHLHRNLFAMLGIFLAVDFVLFLTFGVLFLDGMEFTGIRLLSEDAPVVTFRASDYFRNCTFWCMLEDIGMTAIYYGYMFRYPERINKQIDVVYFWLLHINSKIFLNLHSTAQFLGVLEYARESNWREFALSDADFIKPASCFVTSRNSLLLSLSVILITFWILIHYPDWKKKPGKFLFPVMLDGSMFLLWNGRIRTSVKFGIILILGICLGISVALTRRGWTFPEHSKKTSAKNNKTDLHRIVTVYAGIFIAVSMIWAVIRFVILPSDNKNSLFGMQYSAILKFLTPVFVIVNLLLVKMEKNAPEKYVQHSGNLYQSNALTLILTGCLVLMLFGEFGTIVCILGMTAIMYLLLVDFSDDVKLLKYKIPLSLLAGILLGGGMILIENAFFQISLHAGSSGELSLGGELGGIFFNHWLCIFLGIAALILLIFLYCREFLALLPFQVGLHLKINVLNWIEKKFRKLNIHFLHPGQNNRKNQENQEYAKAPKNLCSICIIIPIVGVLVIYYNFFLNAYSGRTVLKNYYMTAGNFSNEFEITENITQKRATDVRMAISMQNSENPENFRNPENSENTEIPDSVKQLLNQQSAVQHSGKEIKEYFDLVEPDSTLAQLESYYPTKFYTGYYLKLMQVIDRLCYSSRTAELSAVQKGLKQNMGFDIQETSQNQTYISSLQRKYFVTKQDVLDSSQEVRDVYYNPDGTLKDTFFILNQNGKPVQDDETEYLWYYEDTKIPYGVTYHDQQTVIYEVDAKELQRIFKYAEPMTAGSDYVLYTLSRMGVGNVLLLIFIPYFFMLVLLLMTNMNITLRENTASGYFRYVLHQLGTVYAVSFMIQTIVIVWGVFGVSLFSGLSLPLVASGNFEMFLNSICTAVIFISVGNPNQIYSDLK
ncbi:MAG: hypothetical protein K2H29_04295 [Oscillospiraceae bacterium]|nr:hypothetical protein [Oscillospiraceae bacterium]